MEIYYHTLGETEMYNESVYGGEKIIAQMDARIQPYDVRIPDCICALVLTEKFPGGSGR